MIQEKCGRFTFNNYPKTIGLMIKDAKDEYNEAYKAVGQCNIEQQKLLHEMEKVSTAKELIPIAWDLKKIRDERRFYKAKVSYLQKFIDALNTNYNEKTISRITDPKLCSYKDYVYKPKYEKTLEDFA